VLQRVIDTLTFPLRAFSMFEHGRFGLSSLADERFDYVGRHIRGRVLDVGCGRNDRFVRDYAPEGSLGIDVFAYEGLRPEQVVPDMTQMPFADATFDSVTFIANLNHVPEPERDAELAEAYRVLRPGGVMVVTMGNPVSEVTVHKVVALYDKVFGSNIDMDSERGMHEDEDYYLLNREILERLGKAGFCEIKKEYFLTQWGFNHLFVARKAA
jgi:SAM-dependent methyltransferase